MTESGSESGATPEEQPGGGGLSRRKMLGGLAAGAGVAAAGALAAGCDSNGGTSSGDGPPGYGTGINDGFDGKIELDIRDSKPDWKPFELKRPPPAHRTSWWFSLMTQAWLPGRPTAGASICR